MRHFIPLKMILDLGHLRFGNDKDQESSMDNVSKLEADMEDDGTVRVCTTTLCCYGVDI